MPTFDDAGPFSDVPIDDVRLTNAPLVTVLAQLRFPGPLGVLLGEDPVARFAGAFADEGYPLVERGQQVNLEISPQGVKTLPVGNRWTLLTADRRWQVSLTPEFVTLSTGSYTHRDDFLQRVIRVVDVLSASLPVPGVSRVGYRYINRIAGLSQEEIQPLFREALHGGLAVPEGDAHLYGSVSETTFSFDAVDSPTGVRDGLLARWGHLQPGFVLDPSVPPVDVSSWVLDMDAFRHTEITFDRDSVAAQVADMSVRAYRFFRWVVTPAFLDRFERES